MYDSAHYMTFLVYQYLGIDPTSESPTDLARDRADDHVIYPPADVVNTLVVDRMPGAEATRERARVWTQFVSNDYR
jgi:hypothetical protein